jgi:predicted lipoprotein with Yx(FWY)xxD motif
MKPLTLLFGAETSAHTGPPATPGEIALFEEGGRYVVRTDADSLSIYTFDRDTPGKSSCNQHCAENWRPILVHGDPRAVGSWTAIKRDDGRMQWAFKGKPVYTFVKDSAGRPSGDGMGGFHLLNLGPVN